MNTKKWLSFGTKASTPSLPEVDELYRQAIEPLNEDVRLEYCERLLCRTEYFLRNAQQEKEVQQLKELAKAASNEISNLNRHST